MIPTFALLTAAILALWLPGAVPGSPLRRYFWCAPYLAALVAALAGGIVQPLGVVWIGALAAAALAFVRTEEGKRIPHYAATVALLVLAAGLMAHQLPGFANPRVIPALHFTSDAVPYRLHLNFDKTAVGLLLLAFCHERIARAAEWRAMLVTTAPMAAGVIAVLLLLAMGFGYVRLEPKFPPQSWLWMWVNLCFTCVAEEALFRGFIQARLQRVWRHLPRGPLLALAVASVLFGLAHAGGGAAYVALSTVAGFGYGWAYQRTGRIEASILTHFALNATHFFFFTYPALQRG